MKKVKTIVPFYKSKTFWLNAITVGVMTAELIGQFDTRFVAYTGLISGFLNILLRVYYPAKPLSTGIFKR